MVRHLIAIAILLATFVPLMAADSSPLPGAKRVVVLGDSITYSGAYVEFIEAWFATRFPERQIEFLNIGLPSETVSGLSEEGHAGGKFPRPDVHERLERVLAKAKPDLVIACYGMNCGIYLPFAEERFAKYRDGLTWLRERCAAAGAKVLHVTPPTFDEVQGGKPGYRNTLDRYADWLLSQRKQGWDVVDLHQPMNRYLDEHRKADPKFFLAKDGVHCNETGHWIIAKQILLHIGAKDVADFAESKAMVETHVNGAAILKLIQQRQRMLKDAWLTETKHLRPGMKTGLPLAEASAKGAELDVQIHQLARAPKTAAAGTALFPGKRSEWNGYERYDFDVNGRTAIVVAPKAAAPGKPWLWRGEFFGHQPGADLALLAKGFHVVYLGVQNMLGCPDAVKAWDGFYQELTGKYGFAKKVALVGMSRGGLYCYNWAIANPDKVACIYGDAPVCDFKSWPGGKGKGKGSKNDWALVMKVYHFANEAEALAYKGNPIDNLKPLADAKVPLIHVYGDADDVVPWDENTKVIAERYAKLGGSIQLISKPGVGHHPHGLEDPTPVVEFILKHASVK